MNNKIKVIVISGPTACGKTSVAVSLARRYNGEIVSADSRQVYKGLDIGTGKDIAEYSSGGQPIKYHLIDIVSPNDDYNLKNFCVDAEKAVRDINARGKLPVIAGGTPLYLDAILRGYEMPGGPPDEERRKELRAKTIPEMLEILRTLSETEYEKLHERNNPTRIIRAIEKASGRNCPYTPFNKDLDVLFIGVYRTRAEVHRRIEARLDQRLASGMIEEAVRLHKEGMSWERFDYFGLEYRHLALYLQGKMSLSEMREKLFIRIRQFAKAQDIWFRKMEREGLDIHWISPDRMPEMEDLAAKFLAGKTLPQPQLRLKDTFYGPRTN